MSQEKGKSSTLRGLLGSGKSFLTGTPTVAQADEPGPPTRAEEEEPRQHEQLAPLNQLMQTIADQVSSVVHDRIAAFNETLDTKSREMDKRPKKKLKSQKQVSQDKHNREQYEHN